MNGGSLTALAEVRALPAARREDRRPIDSAYTRFVVSPAGMALGAEVSGLDLSEPLDVEAANDLENALGHHGVLFFRDQRLTPAQHLALAARLGGGGGNRFFRLVDGCSEIAEGRTEADRRGALGSGWRAYHSYDEIPVKASIHCAPEVPTITGDTVFASPAAAYESLSDGLRRTLASLKAVHSGRRAIAAARRTFAATEFEARRANAGRAIPEIVHPVIIAHPLTGRKTLYVNPEFTLRFEGWSEAESAPLLAFLYQTIERDEFSCRFVGRIGSLAIWDSRLTWLRSVDRYASQRRPLDRIAARGEPLR